MLLPVLVVMSLQATSPTADAPAERSGRELKIDFQLDAAFFSSADTNGDGALNLTEFTAEIDRRIDAAIARDPEAQKKIGVNERAKMREGMIAPGFRGFDKNSDNSLTKDEVKILSK